MDRVMAGRKITVSGGSWHILIPSAGKVWSPTGHCIRDPNVPLIYR